MMFFTLGGYAMGMHLAMHGPLDGEGIPRALFVVSSDVNGIHLPWFWQPFDSFAFSLAMVALIPGVLAFAFGYLAFRSRIRGVYFSIITQAATVAMWLLFCRNDLKLCGTNGLTNFTHLLGLPLADTGTKIGLYYASLLVLIGAIFLALWLTSTRFGRLLVAIRDNESRLRFAGYQPVWFKSAVFAIGAVFAGIGGALYAPQMGIITPANMQAVESILVVVWVAVGGRGTVIGAVVGAIVINLLYASLTTRVPQLWPFIIGGLFVGVVLFLPDGLVGLWRKLLAQVETKKGGAA
jgi:urea transport system permease protein